MPWSQRGSDDASGDKAGGAALAGSNCPCLSMEMFSSVSCSSVISATGGPSGELPPYCFPGELASLFFGDLSGESDLRGVSVLAVRLHLLAGMWNGIVSLGRGSSRSSWHCGLRVAEQGSSAPRDHGAGS
jgi:hypothetical protein